LSESEIEELVERFEEVMERVGGGRWIEIDTWRVPLFGGSPSSLTIWSAQVEFGALELESFEEVALLELLEG